MLGPFSANISQQTIVLGVTATSPQKRSPSPDRLLGNSSLPLVMSAWSAPFGGSPSSVAEKLVERRFGPQDRLGLRIWEETGNSIARHIWDAAVASVVYLQQIVAGDPAVSVPLLQGLLRGERNTPLHVLELGSGCGVVGIALAELLPQCSVVLTDLPEVEDIVTQNIAVAKPADSSELEFSTLDWDEELPSDLCGGSVDLVLVSDLQMSPEAVILVALKRRHESESIFFDLMQSAGLHNLHLDRKQLPSQHGQFDDIELRCYGRERGVSSSQ
ncbi:hypothetical protein CBS147346_3896 [Aspergillus niger]|nr:hypothetical protein CBS147346_3896 [Aspergillus niger]